MRQFNGAVYQRCLTKQGTQPILVAAIYWAGGFRFFATKDVTCNGIFCEGRIMSMGSFNCRKAVHNRSSVSTISLQLSDHDGLLKTLMDASPTERAPCGLYLTFAGLNQMSLLFKGRVTGPIEWDEGTRTLSLSMESEVESIDVGFAGNDIENQEDRDEIIDAQLNTPWPMIFGKCAHVPALQIKRQGVGRLVRYLRVKSDIYSNPTGQVDLNAPAKTQQYNDATSTIEENVFDVEGGSDFPQNKNITIEIDGCRFLGKFSGDTFTVNTACKPWYENLKLDDNVLDETVNGKPNPEVSTVLFLLGDKPPWPKLLGLYVEVVGKTEALPVNRCVRQINNKCWFEKPFVARSTNKPVRITKNSHIVRAYIIPPNGLRTESYVTAQQSAISYTGKSMPAFVRWELDKMRTQDNMFWDAVPGTEVREVPDNDGTEEYAISAVPMADNGITGVFMLRHKRMSDELSSKTIKVFEPVPKSWWTITYKDTRYNNATILTLARPLKELAGTDVDDQIYVTGSSSIGPNPADIVKWIIETHTDYKINKASFDSVRSTLTGGDNEMNFALFSKINAMQFAIDLSWQGRCGLVQDMGEIYLRYLPARPTPSIVFDESNIEMKTLRLGLTQSVDVITKCVARWTDTYILSPALQVELLSPQDAKFARQAAFFVGRRESDNTNYEIFKQNTDKYGLVEKDFDFYAFNTKAAVQKSLNFWGKRLSNSWRYATFKTFMPSILLQIFDGVQLNLSTASSVTGMSLVGVVDNIEFDPKDDSFNIGVWLPSVAGSLVESEDAYE